MNLQTGDIILSYKEPEPGWFPLDRPVNRFFHDRLLDRQRQEYPGGSIRWDHVRIVVLRGEIESSEFVLIGESTFPLARVTPLEPWMLDPSYSQVFRCTLPILNPLGGLTEALDLSGRVYDIGQLFAIYTGFRRFDWGRRNMVCSVYARHLLQNMTETNFETLGAPKLNSTLPAFFANTPDLLVPVQI